MCGLIGLYIWDFICVGDSVDFGEEFVFVAYGVGAGQKEKGT